MKRAISSAQNDTALVVGIKTFCHLSVNKVLKYNPFKPQLPQTTMGIWSVYCWTCSHWISLQNQVECAIGTVNRYFRLQFFMWAERSELFCRSALKRISVISAHRSVPAPRRPLRTPFRSFFPTPHRSAPLIRLFGPKRESGFLYYF